MFIKQQWGKSLWASLAICFVMLYSAQSAAVGTGWNSSSDPNAPYGLCLSGSNGSELGSKPSRVFAVGGTLTDVLAIMVLDCRPFTGAGPDLKVSCPANSPYAYCVRNTNDGLGNDIKLGVLKLNAKTEPNGLYSGCPDGAELKSKLRLVTLAKRDPRRIKGIVTLSCGAATQPNPTEPVDVSCPAGPDPYGDYCLSTPNDGFGNAVTIGVVAANGAGDPYALYGECNTALSAYGVKPGFKAKAKLVTSVGRSMANVRSIDIESCHASSPGWPKDLNAGSCSSVPGVSSFWASRYSYCIWGTDGKGNGLVAGVNTN